MPPITARGSYEMEHGHILANETESAKADGLKHGADETP